MLSNMYIPKGIDYSHPDGTLEWGVSISKLVFEIPLLPPTSKPVPKITAIFLNFGRASESTSLLSNDTCDLSHDGRGRHHTLTRLHSSEKGQRVWPERSLWIGRSYIRCHPQEHVRVRKAHALLVARLAPQLGEGV